ncbi:MAG TPA: c-type cytochrome [Candidatus Angelobacter sp.]|nr:c-type cytochrome [Candidatus Angelobacter sp.]
MPSIFRSILQRQRVLNSYSPTGLVIAFISVLAVWALATLVNPPASATAASVVHTGDSASHGRELYDKKCLMCHSLDSDRKAPRLRGVFGRKAGSVSSFKYSEALKTANLTWDADSLDKWLADPDKFIPDNDMDFRLESAPDRADIIAYLRQLSNQ